MHSFEWLIFLSITEESPSFMNVPKRCQSGSRVCSFVRVRKNKTCYRGEGCAQEMHSSVNAQHRRNLMLSQVEQPLVSQTISYSIMLKVFVVLSFSCAAPSSGDSRYVFCSVPGMLSATYLLVAAAAMYITPVRTKLLLVEAGGTQMPWRNLLSLVRFPDALLSTWEPFDWLLGLPFSEATSLSSFTISVGMLKM